MIRKRGNTYAVLDHTGKKVLGAYNTKEAAEKRLREIEYFKNNPKPKKTK